MLCETFFAAMMPQNWTNKGLERCVGCCGNLNFAARMPQNGTSGALLQLIVYLSGGGVFGGFYQAVGADIYWASN